MLLLIGCSKSPEPKVITKIEYQYVTPPKEWVKERHDTPYQGKTNEDLLMHWNHRGEIIKQHNLDKRKLQLWIKSFDNENGFNLYDQREQGNENGK